jgi:hypothetical protein
MMPEQSSGAASTAERSSEIRWAKASGATAYSANPPSTS